MHDGLLRGMADAGSRRISPKRAARGWPSWKERERSGGWTGSGSGSVQSSPYISYCTVQQYSVSVLCVPQGLDGRLQTHVSEKRSMDELATLFALHTSMRLIASHPLYSLLPVALRWPHNRAVGAAVLSFLCGVMWKGREEKGRAGLGTVVRGEASR